MWRLLLVSVLFFSLTKGVNTREVDQTKIIDAHNGYRKMVGVENLKYSDECSKYAQHWAEYLAKRNNGLEHSHTSKYGENIYWNSGQATEVEVIALWAKEKEQFNTRNRKHNHKNGHYSQMVWRNTKFVGTGMAIAKDGSEYWVCTYYPAGNYIGEKAY